MLNSHILFHLRLEILQQENIFEGNYFIKGIINFILMCLSKQTTATFFLVSLSLLLIDWHVRFGNDSWAQMNNSTGVWIARFVHWRLILRANFFHNDEEWDWFFLYSNWILVCPGKYIILIILLKVVSIYLSK